MDHGADHHISDAAQKGQHGHATVRLDAQDQKVREEADRV